MPKRRKKHKGANRSTIAPNSRSGADRGSAQSTGKRSPERNVARKKRHRKTATLLIGGTRTFADNELLEDELKWLKRKYDIKVVVVGGSIDKDGVCRQYGADRLAQKWAESKLGVGVYIHTHWADWKKHKKAAGPIRNREMVMDLYDGSVGRVKLAVFFWDGRSSGTKDCMRRVRKYGKNEWVKRPAKVRIVRYKE